MKSIDELATLNPVEDAIRMPEAAAGKMLARITETRRTRSPRRHPVLSIAILLALSAVGIVLATAVAGDKVIEVRAADALRDPRAVEQQLRQEGIDARIFSVPSEDLAGKWYHLYLAPGSELDLDTYWLLRSYVGALDMRFPSVNERCPIGDCARTALLEIPANVRGPMTLVVGREPQPGEDSYWMDAFGMNELAPSGALWCYQLEEKTPPEAARIVRDLGYLVSWERETSNTTEVVQVPPEKGVVAFALFRGPGEVSLVVAERDGATKYMTAEGTPTPEHPRSSAPWAPAC